MGILACFILTIITFLFLLWDIKCGLLGQLRSWHPDKVGYFVPVLLLWIIFATIYYTSGSPTHYDTALYHAQAIRWVEEYGVVKGLGNLHFRFAYNSSFIPLQALFSLKWLTGQSLHSVNGFVACGMLLYVTCTNRFLHGQKGRVSDFLKVAVTVYIVTNRSHLSSPSTDTMALLLVGYVFVKWTEYIENDEKDVKSWIYLSVLAVWGITLKLSVAPMVLIAIYPFCRLIKDKKWGLLIRSLIIGVGILLPWMVRSVIISGYLVYPYSFLDIFSVDWKMPAAVLDCDKKEIIVWGRGLKKVSLYELGLLEWFPVWFQTNSLKNRVLFVCAVASFLALMFLIVRNLIERKWNESGICVMAVIVFGFWFFTAPLFRYGSIYCWIQIALVAGYWYRKCEKELIKEVVLLCLMMQFAPYMDVLDYDFEWIRQGDYQWHADIECSIENIKIWIPEEGDQIGYAVFPSTPYESVLAIIELRGDALEDGFKVKEEYKDRVKDGYGIVED